MPGLTGGIFDMVGTAVNNIYGRWSNERDFGYQKDLNNNAVSIRVADAQRAGIHPLYALGPTGASFSPVSTNFQSAGQELSRAQMANMDREQREREIRLQADSAARADQRADARNAAEIANLNANTELIRSQIARNASQLGPGGQTPSSRAVTVPSRIIAGEEDAPSRQAGNIASHQFQWTPDNQGLSVVPSEQAKERSEDDIIQQIEWWMRHRMPRIVGAPLPHFDFSTPRVPPPTTPLRPGYEWRWSGRRQAFYPARVRRRRQ